MQQALLLALGLVRENGETARLGLDSEGSHWWVPAA